MSEPFATIFTFTPVILYLTFLFFGGKRSFVSDMIVLVSAIFLGMTILFCMNLPYLLIELYFTY